MLQMTVAWKAKIAMINKSRPNDPLVRGDSINTPSDQDNECESSRFIARLISESSLLLKDINSEFQRAAVGDEKELAIGSLLSAHRVPSAGLTHLLASPQTIKDRLYQLAFDEDLCLLFSDEAEKEAMRLVEEGVTKDDWGQSEASGDFTSIPFVTIDNEDSKDLDQALFIEKEGEDYIVHYALADASHYIQPQTALFKDALKRGSSYYLPGFSIPMLPRSLSEGLISLNPQVMRRALIFKIYVKSDASVKDVDLYRGRIISRAKLSYTQVQNFYDQGKENELDQESFAQSLLLLKEIGERLIEASEIRGVVNYNRRELNIDLDENGELITTLRRRLDVERYNEQISLLTNTEGAFLLLKKAKHKNNVQPIFRVHPKPLSGRLEEFKTLINEIIQRHKLDESWKWLGPKKRDGSGERLSDYLARLPKEPRSIRLAIERQALYSNRGSFFEPGPGRHDALKVEAYARFSAPMREIVGIFTHKEILENDLAENNQKNDE